MDKQEDSDKQGKGFFTVNLSLIDGMVKKGAAAEELMAYLVLARGIDKAGRYAALSTHGANSIGNRTGCSNTRAIKALDWLVQHGFIKPIKADTNQSKRTSHKWQLVEVPTELPLANELADGIGRGKGIPPMERIYNQSKGKTIGIARLDTLMLLLHLYKHQELSEYGGINPTAAIYRNWQTAENCQGEKVTDLDGTNAAIYEITGGERTHYLDFSKEALFYVAERTERTERFWDAFNNLQRLNWLYETTQIWSADPSEHKKAEPLYTLYVHDRDIRKRNSEPYLANAINQVAIKQVNPDYGFFNQDGEFDPEADLFGGQFRYVANKKTGGFPIGIYRLKFRPPTKDTGKGMAAEKHRIENWKDQLSRLVSH